MIGHRVGVLAQAIAGTFDLNDDGVMEQAIEQRGGDDGTAEHLTPFGKAVQVGSVEGSCAPFS